MNWPGIYTYRLCLHAHTKHNSRTGCTLLTTGGGSHPFFTFFSGTRTRGNDTAPSWGFLYKCTIIGTLFGLRQESRQAELRAPSLAIFYGRFNDNTAQQNFKPTFSPSHPLHPSPPLPLQHIRPIKCEGYRHPSRRSVRETSGRGASFLSRTRGRLPRRRRCQRRRGRTRSLRPRGPS